MLDAAEDRISDLGGLTVVIMKWSCGSTERSKALTLQHETQGLERWGERV